MLSEPSPVLLTDQSKNIFDTFSLIFCFILVWREEIEWIHHEMSASEWFQPYIALFSTQIKN